MLTTTVGIGAIVVSETDKFDRMSRKAVEKLGTKLRSNRAVKAAVKRFADKIAANPSALRVEVLGVVGYCNPSEDRRFDYEPMMIHEGKPRPVSYIHLAESGEYWVGTKVQINEQRDAIVSSLAANSPRLRSSLRR